MKHVLVYGMTDNPGGIETYLLNFFTRVHGNGVHLDFVSDFPEIAHSHILTERGSKLHFIPAKGKDLWGHLKGMWQILRNHEEYQTLYFNILDAGAVITMLPAFLLGRKIVVHSHNGSTDKVRLHNLCKPVLNWIVKEKVACSNVAAAHMFFGDIRDCFIIPNGIDASRFVPVPELRTQKRVELGVADKLTVCHVGRISNQKNPIRLIDIFVQLKQQCDHAVLLSVGTGEMMEEFKTYINEKNLGNDVLCLGVRKDVPEILQAADVFLFPSLYEGLPISLLEAQAAGLPCVISDTISSESVITDIVKVLSLEQSNGEWAEAVLAAAQISRKDTHDQIIAAGFDISCCSDFDQRLQEKF